MNQATGLDHVGIVGRDLIELASAFEALGFYLTPLARHAGGRTGNRCAMFAEGGYLELMSTVDGGTSSTLERFLARHAGAHILALRIDDTDAVLARLRLAWGTAPTVSHTNRAVDDTDPDGQRARFALITPADQPEGRVHLIQHETQDALWQPRFLRHPNNVVALDEVILTAPAPATTAAWYSALAGRPLVSDSSGGYALMLPHGRIRIVPIGYLNVPAPPCYAALTLRTSDGTVAIRQFLENRSLAHAMTDDGILVQTAGVSLRFF